MSASTPVVTVPDRPPRSTFVLLAVITGAIVANINLGIANVALPTIGRDLGATQDQLTSVADAFALGLAATVLYLGTIGDRYGRKLLFIAGCILTVPTSMLSAWAWNVEVLTVARFLGGIAAALLFPTTLSIISALYRGRARVGAIALWSGLGGGFAAVGPVLGGWLLGSFWWGSVFLITLPLVVVAFVVGLWVLPWRASEEVFPVDHLGGVLSVIGVGALVMSIEHADVGWTTREVVLLVTTVVVLPLFFWRQSRAQRPLIDLHLAGARTFWVAFAVGAITFGSLIGTMFIGQQFTQNVLGFDPLTAAAVVLPAAVTMAVFGQLAGRLVIRYGSQFTFMLGLGAVAAAFAIIMVLWHDGASVGWVLLAYGLMGTGVGLAATPASRSLMSSVPPSRGGMGSAFLDLTRDFGGAVLQAIMGALLAGAYAAHIRDDLAGLPADQAAKVSDTTAAALTSSFDSAQQVAQQFPTYADQIVQAAGTAFTSGKSWAVAVALLLTLLAMGLVLVAYPRKKAEEDYYDTILAADSASSGTAAG